MFQDIPTPDTYKKTHRNGDNQYVHVETGDVVVPPAVLEADPDLARHIAHAISSMGGDPSSRVVGSPSGNYNPQDGEQEFFFKKLKSFFKKNPLAGTAATLASSFIPGGGSWLTPLVSAGTTYLGGGSALQSLGAGAGTYIGGELMGGAEDATIGARLGEAAGGKGMSATLANSTNDLLSTSLPSTIGGAILGKGWGQLQGQLLGGGLGSAVGAMFQPPEQTGLESIPNNPNVMQAQSLPGGSGITLPLPASQAINTPSVTAATPYTPQGVTYSNRTRNRDTGQFNFTQTKDLEDELQAARRRGWGGGVVFA
tara:strand:+ start:6976 stop:7911 length:936 start_codon:yes stop_codon:yes gene_type:complete